MHVGYTPIFQNPDNQLSDVEVYREEVRLAELAEPLGFDSVWSAEAWGMDAIVPLAYMAAVTKDIGLGTGIVQVSARVPSMIAM